MMHSPIFGAMLVQRLRRRPTLIQQWAARTGRCDPVISCSFCQDFVLQTRRARPQTTRARISNPVSGRQCHLIHLTILRRLSWPSLTYTVQLVRDVRVATSRDTARHNNGTT